MSGADSRETLRELVARWRDEASSAHPDSIGKIVKALCADELEAALDRMPTPRCSHCGGTKDNPMPLSGAGARCFDRFHWAAPTDAAGGAGTFCGPGPDELKSYEKELAEAAVIRWLKRPMDGSEEPSYMALLIILAALQKYGERAYAAGQAAKENK